MKQVEDAPSTLRKTAQKLFESEEEQASFIQAIQTRSGPRRALLWMKEPRTHEFSVQEDDAAVLFPALSHVPLAVSLLAPESSAGKEALHEEGAYYCLDISSVLAAAVLGVVPQASTREILDLCAAPGGKTMLASRLFPQAHYTCNEVVGKRIGALISNLKRCKVSPVKVTSLDPSVLLNRCGAHFDICIVDAPCSGQSLPAKDGSWSGAFHPATVNFNANRQRRILANAAGMVRPGGYLAYMTCTFSEKENERTVVWLLKRQREFKAVEVPYLEQYLSPYADFPCYRFLPHRGEGRGSFSVLLQKQQRDTTMCRAENEELPVVWQQACGN